MLMNNLVESKTRTSICRIKAKMLILNKLLANAFVQSANKQMTIQEVLILQTKG
jgi:hypothetical protein